MTERYPVTSGSLLLIPAIQGLFWCFWITLLQALLFHSRLTSGQSVVLFQRATHCPGKALSSSLTYGHVVVRSKLQCAAVCLPDFSCQSFLYHPFNRLCHLGSEPSYINCSNMAPSAELLHYDMTTSCHNGGVLQVGGSCICPHGFMGDNCSTVMRDCDDLYHKGNVRDHGVYWIYPYSSTSPFPVFCRMVNRPRTYIMNRVFNDVNFTRGWQEYKDGFGDLDTDYWLGLDKIHILTISDKYELRFRVRLRSNKNLFQFYQNVYVGSEAENYRLDVDTDVAKGSLGDSMTAVNGANFSTPDRDNDDNSDVNCASLHQAGFWFRGDNCTLCNPTGPLLQPLDQKREGIPNEVFWENDLGDTVPYKLSAFLVNVLERRKNTI